MLPGPVCVALTPLHISDLFAAPVAGADCIEARLDYLEDPEESAGIRWDALPVPAIATCRGKGQGGRFAGSIDDELRILTQAARNGARYVDIDFRFVTSIDGAGVIGSYHNFEGTPQDLEELMGRVCDTQADVAKIATTVCSWADNRRLLDLLGRPWPKPVIVIGMGAMGEITRVIGPARGSALTYASLGRGSAPGQLDLAELVDVCRVHDLGAGTTLIGIVGKPLGHSLSPRLHNRAFRNAGLDCVYLRFPVDDVGDFFANAARIGIAGFSVTIPHKVEVMRYLDGVSREAVAVGAVNTVYREDGKWIGDNTDVHGVRVALAGMDLGDARVVILGTGGAARAAVAALDPGTTVTLLSGSREPGQVEWSRNVPVDRIENYRLYREDLLINATPVGMSPDLDGIPIDEPIHAAAVFDMVYNPEVTRLLARARDQGKRTIPGTVMFAAQAARQFEIWTGRPADPGAFRMGAS